MVLVNRSLGAVSSNPCDGESLLTEATRDGETAPSVRLASGNGDRESAYAAGRPAGGDVRPVSVTAGCGLGANVPQPIPSPPLDWRYWFKSAYTAWLARSEQLSLFDDWFLA